jgi:DNA-binding winged helix-turn-helix (wHTH) protein
MAALERYAFDGCALDVSERRLSCAGQAVTLAPKAFDLLVTLVRDSGRLLTKRELLERVWPQCSVDEGILAVHVSALRKALGDSRRPARYIETVQRSGYRFVAHVTTIGGHQPVLVEQRVDAAVARSRRPQVAERVGRGRSHVLSASRVDLPKAEAAFRAALALDATDAAAHAGLALVHCGRAALHAAVPAEAYSYAKASALRALALDESCVDAHVALGAVMFLSQWEWVAAERSLRRALALDPGHSIAALLRGRLLEALGDLQDGLGMKLRALERDPFSPLVHLEIAMSYFNQRCYDRTIEWARKTLHLDSRHVLAHEVLAAASIANGDGRLEGREVSQPRAGLLGRADYYVDGVLKHALHRRRAQQLVVPHLHRAVLYSAAGENDSAIEYVNCAIDARDPGLLRLTVAPQWDNLRSDPRFDRCLERMGLRAIDHSTRRSSNRPFRRMATGYR